MSDVRLAVSERLGSSPKVKNSVDSAKTKTKISAIAARAGATRTIMSLPDYVRGGSTVYWAWRLATSSLRGISDQIYPVI